MPNSEPRSDVCGGFRKYFIECLALAMAAYPEARVDLVPSVVDTAADL